MPIVPVCSALIIRSRFAGKAAHVVEYVNEAEIFRGWFIPDNVNGWFVEFDNRVGVFPASCLMRIDGGDFETKRESEKELVKA